MKQKPMDDVYALNTNTRRYVNGGISPVYKRALSRIARRKKIAQQQKQR